MSHQGIFIAGRRPKSKKEVKEAVLADPSRVRLERTAWVGDEYDGPVDQAPDGTHYFAGPDPTFNRKFYGQVVVKNGKVRVK